MHFLQNAANDAARSNATPCAPCAAASSAPSSMRLDGSDREERPYTVTESSYGLRGGRASRPGGDDESACTSSSRTRTPSAPPSGSAATIPMTQFSFTRYTDDADKFDPFGRPLAQTQIACPRGWRTFDRQPSEPYLATRRAPSMPGQPTRKCISTTGSRRRPATRF